MSRLDVCPFLSPPALRRPRSRSPAAITNQGLLVDEHRRGRSTRAIDAFVPRDAGRDARDAREEDALPPIDVVVPLDTERPLICTDAGATQIYVITEQNILYSFYPPTQAFQEIGTIACPTVGVTTSGAPTPFSMAVNNQGIANIIFQNDGELFRVSTATAACEATTFVQDQDGFCDFGMCYSADETDAGETFYVAADPQLDNNCPGAGVTEATLASIDPNLVVHPIGPFTGASVVGAELTGTGAGQLFAFYSHVHEHRPRLVHRADRQDDRGGRRRNDSPRREPGGRVGLRVLGGRFLRLRVGDRLDVLGRLPLPAVGSVGHAPAHDAERHRRRRRLDVRSGALSRPLAGKRVLVARPAEQSSSTVELLEARGAHADRARRRSRFTIRSIPSRCGGRFVSSGRTGGSRSRAPTASSGRCGRSNGKGEGRRRSRG